MPATVEEIERLARELHVERGKVEQKAHGQGSVPWDQLGESYRVSLRRMAQEKLEGSK
jgi:hypothetical protein